MGTRTFEQEDAEIAEEDYGQSFAFGVRIRVDSTQEEKANGFTRICANCLLLISCDWCDSWFSNSLLTRWQTGFEQEDAEIAEEDGW